MIISTESMNFKDPKESDDPQLFDDPQVFDDPQLFHDQLEVWTLINQKSTVIPLSLMVLLGFLHAQSFFWKVATWKVLGFVPLVKGRVKGKQALL